VWDDEPPLVEGMCGHECRGSRPPTRAYLSVPPHAYLIMRTIRYPPTNRQEEKIPLLTRLCPSPTHRAGYVEQDDLFVPSMTVREHLVFHAMVRLGTGVARGDKLAQVRCP
jgi:hypothetical protein